MNKSELTKQAKFDDKTLDTILEALGIPKDLPDYTDEHLKLVQVIKDIHKNEGCKSWAEAVGIHRKPINEAHLNEIAARYSIVDRIPEITSALKLKTENITDEQFEQFRVVCEQVQKGMDLGMVANAQLEKGKAAKVKPALPEFASQQEPGSAIAPTKDKPMPGLVVQDNNAIEGIPLDLEGNMTQLWDETLDRRVEVDASAIVGAPFDAIDDASDEISPDKLYASYRGRYFQGMKQRLDSPEMLAYAKDRAKGKKSST